MLCTGSHDRRSPTFEFDNAPIEIGDLNVAGDRATVLRGVNVEPVRPSVRRRSSPAM